MPTEKTTIQAQAVIYHNDKQALLKTLEHLSNAIRVERGERGRLGQVKMVYGDASETPVFSEEEFAGIRETFGGFIDLEYRFFGFNSGFGKGQNLLAEDCRSDYLLVMNPDIMVNPRFFLDMLSPFSDAAVGMVEARQTPVEHHKEYDMTTLETDWAAMACVLIPTPVWKKLKGIDCDTFFMYCEDVDFSWRLRLLGYKIIYQAGAPVFHAKRIGSKGQWQPGSAEVYYSAESALLMAHKWANRKLEKSILNDFESSSNQIYRDIAENFKKREKEGRLPEPVEGAEKVAVFENGYYSKNRFVY